MKLDFERWEKTPAINGRLATKKDFEKGVAIFYQEGAAEPVRERTLPSLAKYTDDDGKIFKAVVVQMEKQIRNGQVGVVVCGVYLEDGRSVVCTSKELDFLA